MLDHSTAGAVVVGIVSVVIAAGIETMSFLHRRRRSKRSETEKLVSRPRFGRVETEEVALGPRFERMQPEEVGSEHLMVDMDSPWKHRG